MSVSLNYNAPVAASQQQCIEYIAVELQHSNRKDVMEIYCSSQHGCNSVQNPYLTKLNLIAIIG